MVVDPADPANPADPRGPASLAFDRLDDSVEDNDAVDDSVDVDIEVRQDQAFLWQDDLVLPLSLSLPL